MKTLAILFMVTALTACNTVAGIGTDIQKSAEWTKEKMTGSKVDLNQNQNK
jgi:predicted small secreted protein